MNVLRPACYSDVQSTLCEAFMASSPTARRYHVLYLCSLRELYDAEWRKRGFERSP